MSSQSAKKILKRGETLWAMVLDTLWTAREGIWRRLALGGGHRECPGICLTIEQRKWAYVILCLLLIS